MGHRASSNAKQTGDSTTLPNTRVFEIQTGEDKGLRVPVVRGQLEPQLLELLRNAKEFACTEDDIESLGYSKCRDYGHPDDHVYYEGYFHGLSCATPVQSINPRLGYTFPKPASPFALRAFLACFRRQNDEMIKSALGGVKSAISVDWAFGDVAAQSHCGEGVQITPDEMTGWHMDAPNSLLHLALSIRGTRVLHFSDNGDNRDMTAEMTEGDVYLTCPAAFLHAVEYPTCTWDNRVLALQCRILFADDTFELLRSKKISLIAARKEACRAILEKGLQLPSFEEVTRVMKELEDGASSPSSPEGSAQAEPEEAQ